MALFSDPFKRLLESAGRTQTDWGTILNVSGYAAPGMDLHHTGNYGGGGLIFLGRDYGEDSGDMGAMPTGSSWAQLDPYLTQASRHGEWRDLESVFQSRLTEIAGISGDALDTMNQIYDELSRGNRAWQDSPSTASGAFSWTPGSGDQDTAASNRRDLEASLGAHAANRQKYDSLVEQFNTTYTGAIEQHQRQEREHAERLAELGRQREAAEAAARRSQAWASNMPLQNRQNENLPDTVTAGTADGGEGGDMGGDLGGKPRRRRGSLSSNLGINV